MKSKSDWIDFCSLILSAIGIIATAVSFYQKRQESLESAKQSARQQLTTCAGEYAKIYAEKALFFEEFIERCTDKDFSKYISNIKDKQARDKCYEEIHNDTYILNNIQQQQQTIASWAANKFICEIQSFIDAVLILEQQLNDDERKKFYAMVKIYSSNFIELFEMVNSLENYTPTNKTAFDNTQRVFKALQNKKQ